MVLPPQCRVGWARRRKLLTWLPRSGYLVALNCRILSPISSHLNPAGSLTDVEEPDTKPDFHRIACTPALFKNGGLIAHERQQYEENR